MTQYIAGFICALVLAALLVLWLIFCMFVRERHRRFAQYDISDILRRNHEIAIEANKEKCPEKKIGLSAGIFVLPSRHKHKDDYLKRPDYPESPLPAPVRMSTDKLVELFTESATDDFYNDGNLEIDTNAKYISDV